MSNKYALILGCSSGFGKATALELAKNGYSIYGVHFDRGKMKEAAEEFRKELETHGVKAIFFNTNAASDTNRTEVIDAINQNASVVKGHQLRVLIHSLAFGSLKYLVNEDASKALTRKQIEMTMDVMANSLIYWTQDLLTNNLLADNSRIIAFSSIGASRAMLNYGAVSAAKAALESYIRQLAVELSYKGITSNSIFAGLTATPAASKIPGFEEMSKLSQKGNPFKRLTTEQDVANVVRSLVAEEMNWINGETIRVDGGEAIYVHYDKEESDN